MKSILSIRLYIVFSLCGILWINDLRGQENNWSIVDYSKYKNPDYKDYNLLLNLNLGNDIFDYPNDLERLKKYFVQPYLSFSAEHNKRKNILKYQGRLAMTRYLENEKEVNYRTISENSYSLANLLYFEHYIKPHFFINCNMKSDVMKSGDRVFYGYKPDIGQLMYRWTIIGNLQYGIGLGYGRIENLNFLNSAEYIFSRMYKYNLLTRSPNVNEYIEIANVISKPRPRAVKSLRNWRIYRNNAIAKSIRDFNLSNDSLNELSAIIDDIANLESYLQRQSGFRTTINGYLLKTYRNFQNYNYYHNKYNINSYGYNALAGAMTYDLSYYKPIKQRWDIIFNGQWIINMKVKETSIVNNTLIDRFDYRSWGVALVGKCSYRINFISSVELELRTHISRYLSAFRDVNPYPVAGPVLEVANYYLYSGRLEKLRFYSLGIHYRTSFMPALVLRVGAGVNMFKHTNFYSKYLNMWFTAYYRLL